MHWVLLHWFLTFHNGSVGRERYCAFDMDARIWECNYQTARECLAYNEYCGERGE